MILLELFTSKAEWTNVPPHPRTPSAKRYKFRIGEIEYEAGFDEDKDGSDRWELTFNAAKGGELPKIDMTGYGNAIRVISTVAEITKAFLREADPAEVYFEASPFEPSRVSLYRRLAGSLTQGTKYVSSETKGGAYIYFHIIKKDT